MMPIMRRKVKVLMRLLLSVGTNSRIVHLAIPTAHSNSTISPGGFTNAMTMRRLRTPQILMTLFGTRRRLCPSTVHLAVAIVQ